MMARRKRKAAAAIPAPGGPSTTPKPKLVPFPLGNYAMQIQTLLRAPETRTNAVLRELWARTWHYWRKAWAKYLLFRNDMPQAQRDDFDKQLEGFEFRMGRYKQALEQTDNLDALKRTVVKGFLVNYPKSGHHVADYLFPMSFVNQIDAVLETLLEANKEMFVETPKAVARQLEKIAEAADKLIEFLEKWGVWLVGSIAATVIGGVIVVKLTEKRR